MEFEIPPSSSRSMPFGNGVYMANLAHGTVAKRPGSKPCAASKPIFVHDGRGRFFRTNQIALFDDVFNA